MRFGESTQSNQAKITFKNTGLRSDLPPHASPHAVHGALHAASVRGGPGERHELWRAALLPISNGVHLCGLSRARGRGGPFQSSTTTVVAPESLPMVSPTGNGPDRPFKFAAFPSAVKVNALLSSGLILISSHRQAGRVSGSPVLTVVLDRAAVQPATAPF
jgi:hypothetical protein